MAPAQQALCPYDRQPILEADDIVVCPGCHRPAHRECWEELGGCAFYGCPNMVEIKKSTEVTATFWGDSEKVCPFCAERIPVGAIDCPLCRMAFGEVRPLSRESVMVQAPDLDFKRLHNQAILLLVFSVIGCTSPFALVAGLMWYRTNKAAIERFSNVKAIGVISIAASMIYLAFGCIGLLIWFLTQRTV